ncbi:MAG: alanine racemase [Candidatus Lloydbacteria bacterium]|nr:alanine racemase [Candidatus Lloydbacteria bacterium]
MKKKSVDTKGLRTWVEIDTKALKHNFSIFRNRVTPQVQLMAIAKSNAYGHGLAPYAKTMERFGADWLGVDSIKEALRLREEGIKCPMLVLGYTLPENISLGARYRIDLTVSTKEGLSCCAKLSQSDKQKLRIHLKIDTGMGRQGFLLEDMPNTVRFLKKHFQKKTIAGVYTHFAAAKNPSFPKETLEQVERFKKAVALLQHAGFTPIRHACATSGTLLFPSAHFDMVRIGIGLFGLWPAKEVQAAHEDRVFLKPALSWKTIIGEVKTFRRGSGIGYDLTERLPAGSRIAVCPIGYWHGYPRSLSSIGRGLVRGKNAKILGRISMDMIAIDISRIANARVGDEVVLIGRDKNACITADELASLANTTNYEIVTRINPLIKRIYL